LIIDKNSLVGGLKIAKRGIVCQGIFDKIFCYCRGFFGGNSVDFPFRGGEILNARSDYVFGIFAFEVVDSKGNPRKHASRKLYVTNPAFSFDIWWLRIIVKDHVI